MLMSGGIDSTTLLAQLSAQGKEIICVFFNYGQENYNETIKCAEYQCKKYNAELKTITIPFDWSKASIIKGNFIAEGINDANVYSKNVKELSWVPARNATMLLVAGGIASENNIKEVYCSFQFDTNEWQEYDALKLKYKFGAADLTPRFLLYLNKLSNFCYKTKVKFVAPYINEKLNCNDIVRIGKQLNVDYHNTYSCRYEINGKPCLECEQCIIRKSRLEAK